MSHSDSFWKIVPNVSDGFAKQKLWIGGGWGEFYPYFV